MPRRGKPEICADTKISLNQGIRSLIDHDHDNLVGFPDRPRANRRSSPTPQSNKAENPHCSRQCSQRTPAIGGERMPPSTAPSPATGARRLPADVESSLSQIEMEYQAGELTQRGYEIRRSRILSAIDLANLDLSGERLPTSAGVSSTLPLTRYLPSTLN